MKIPHLSRDTSTARLAPVDRRNAWLGGLFLFCFIAAITIIKSASNGLLLVTFSVSVLPWLYIATPAAVAAALLLLVTPRGRGRVALGSFGGAALALLLWFVLLRQHGPAELALYLFGEALATSLSICFWEQIGVLFDSRTARRIFGLLGAAGMAGSVVGGLFVNRAVEAIGTAALLPFAAGALVVAGVASVLLGRQVAVRGDFARGQDLQELPARNSKLGLWWLGLRFLATDRYPRNIAALTMLLSVLTVAVDFLFRSRAQDVLSGDQLTAIFGTVNLAVGLISIGFQWFFTGYLLTHLNVRGYLLTLLGGLGLAAAAGLAGFGFSAVFLLKVVESAIALSLAQPAIQLLYHPLPPGRRVVLRGLVDGLLKKVGIAAGGAVLLISLPLASRLVSEVGVLLLLLPAAALLLVLHRQQRALLVERVKLAFQTASAPQLVEEGGSSSLEQALLASEPRQVLAALALARRNPGFDLTAHLSRLVTHPAPEVRRAAARLAGPGDAPFLHMMSLLTAERSAVQADEVRSLAELLPEQAPQLLERLLRSPDPGVRSEAIEALYPLEVERGEGPAHALLQRLVLWCRSAPPAERQQLAELIGRLRRPELVSLLQPFLRDTDLAVRRAAVRAAGRIAAPALVPKLLELLGVRELRQTALKALSRYGDAVVDTCEQWLNDRSRTLEIRLRLPELLRRVGTAQAGRVLLFSNIEDDPFLRDRIAQALAALHQDHPDVVFDRGWTIQAMERRLNSLDYYLPVYAALTPLLVRGHLLQRILADRLLQNLCVLLRLASLLQPAATMSAIRIRWLLGTRHQRADALNLLETLVDSELRPRLMAALEQFDRLRDAGLVPITTGVRVGGDEGGDDPDWREIPQPEPGRLGGRPLTLAALGPGALAHLVELARSRDPLLRAIVHRTLGEADAELVQAVGPLPPLLETEMPEALMERVLFLQSVDLFEHQQVDDLVAIAAIAQERNFAAGTEVYHEGDPSDALYLLVEGELELFLGGKPLLATRCGESFGQLSMLDRKPRPTTAVARTDVRTLSLSRLDFFELIADRSELLQGLVEVLVKRIRTLLQDLALRE